MPLLTGARGHLLLVAVAAVAVVALAVGGIPAAPDAGPSAAANASTPPHVHPDHAAARGDLTDLERWLIGRIGERLAENSSRLDRGEYERASELVNESRGRYLKRYVNLTDETAGASDDRRAGTFRRAQIAQHRTARAAAAYNDTYQDYRSASSPETPSRAQARDLERLAGQVRDNGSRAVAAYRAIARTTGRNVSTEIAAIETTVADVTDRQAAVRAETFTATTITARANRSTTSVVRPVSVTGRLTTVAGEPLANLSVRLRIGNRTFTPRTDADGDYAVVYRPTPGTRTASNLTVAYRPGNTSPYLGDATSADVAVIAVEPAVTVEVAPTRPAFRDTLTVTGRVDVDGLGGVPGVPVTVTAGGHRLGTLRTDAAGSFRLSRALPAEVRSGSRAVRARVDWASESAPRALGESGAATTVRVEETRTALTADATREAAGERVRIRGRLRTVDGRAVADQPVAIEAGGEPIATPRTNESGWYVTAVGPPPDRALTVRYDGFGTSLGAARTTAAVPAAGTGGSLRDRLPVPVRQTADRYPLLMGLVGVLLVVLLVVWTLVGLRWITGRGGGPAQGGSGDGPGDATGPGGGMALLNRAREQLQAGRPNDAVVTGYAAVRRSVEPEGRAAHRTHWEFYRSFGHEVSDEERITALRDLTEGYERVAYAAGQVQAATGEALLEAAGTLLEADASGMEADGGLFGQE